MLYYEITGTNILPAPETEAVLTGTSDPALNAEPRPPAVESLVGSIKVKALHGTAWTIAAYVIAMGLRLVSNIILNPYPCSAALRINDAADHRHHGFDVVSDLGLTPNIVRSSRGDEPEFLNTAWTMQVLRGTALWICCLCLYSAVCKLLPRAAASDDGADHWFFSVISSFNSTSLASFSRRMAVRELAFVDLSVQAANWSLP